MTTNQYKNVFRTWRCLLLLALALQACCAGADQPKQRDQQEARRLQNGLQAYQRYTPRPTTLAPSKAPSSIPPPITSSNQGAQTDPPRTGSLPAELQDEVEGGGDTTTDGGNTEEGSSLDEVPPPPASTTDPLTPADVTRSPTSQPPTSAPTLDEGILYEEFHVHNETLGAVEMTFSLYFPHVDPLDVNFMTLNGAIQSSLQMWFCDEEETAEKEKNDEEENKEAPSCQLRDNVLDVMFALPTLSGNKEDNTESTAASAPTVLALESTKVHDAEDTIHSGTTTFRWSTWTLCWRVLQLGTKLGGGDRTVSSRATPTKDDVQIEGVAVLQERMNQAMEALIREDILEENVNDYLRQFPPEATSTTTGEHLKIKTSMKGEELASFGVLIPYHGPNDEGMDKELEGGDQDGGEDGGDVLVILFFVGLGAAFVVIAALIIWAIRSRRIQRQRNFSAKQTTGHSTNAMMVISTTRNDNDDTSKSSKSSELPATPPPAANRRVKSKQQRLQEEAAKREQSRRASAKRRRRKSGGANSQASKKSTMSGAEELDVDAMMEEGAGDPMFVIDGAAAAAMRRDPLAGATESENWNDADAELAAQIAAAESASTAQASYYTGGSISAITGLSALENSETWSVGSMNSMSIDLAEWG